jgi:hypothetical protein
MESHAYSDAHCHLQESCKKEWEAWLYGCFKNKFTMVFQMLLCSECHENVYT